MVAHALEMEAGVKGCGAPIIVDAGKIDGIVAESSHEGGDLVLAKPFLNFSVALVENPDIGLVIFYEVLQSGGWVLEVKNSGGDEFEFVGPLLEKLAKGVKFGQKLRGELEEFFGGKEGDPLGGGVWGGGRWVENGASFSVLAFRNHVFFLKDLECGAEGVAPDL